MPNEFVLLRGGGDLASGVALRLHHAGFAVVIIELPQPLAVRRAVSFSEAVYDGQVTVEDISARRATPEQIDEIISRNEIPVLVDAQAEILRGAHYEIVVDARMAKTPPEPLPRRVPLHIGLGPGFYAGRDCAAVVETRRGHTLGRVYWSGSTLPDSGQPEGDSRRVLRAPTDGVLLVRATIGEHLEAGQLAAEIKTKNDIQTSAVVTPLKGVLRGILRDGITVTSGMKIGDVDPRDDPALCHLVSDKALAVGGGVLEAILTKLHRDDSD